MSTVMPRAVPAAPADDTGSPDGRIGRRLIAFLLVCHLAAMMFLVMAVLWRTLPGPPKK